ncbi:hypothetical protein [Lysobacter sp. CA199]|uniref:hypothetical protein n=1 Tax=Lysobacter sp. CA199 TaxID=3455608 RepID=UPI003F8D6C19
MPQDNIDDFNRVAAHIFGRLYASFPLRISLEPQEGALAPRFAESDPKAIQMEIISRQHALWRIYFDTALFLLEEGYIRGNVTGDSVVLTECALTVKGLLALQRMPEALIQEKEKTPGDWLVSVAKDTAKEVPKALVSGVIKAVLA